MHIVQLSLLANNNQAVKLRGTMEEQMKRWLREFWSDEERAAETILDWLCAIGVTFGALAVVFSILMFKAMNG